MNKRVGRTRIPLDSDINKGHLLAYMNQLIKFLFNSLLFILFVDVFVLIFTKMGFFSNHVNIVRRGRNNSYSSFVINILIVNLSSWLVFLIYYIFYTCKKFSYKFKKIALCGLFLAIATIYAFGFYKFNYLSFLYALPIIITIPLGTKYRKGVFAAGVVLSCIYALYQNFLINENYNWLMNSVTLIALVLSYFLCTSVYKAYSKAIYDIKEYNAEICKLNDNISHDFSTGAFSKCALYSDLLNETQYKSIAFIDLDDFKNINDEKGHEIGDKILKHFVSYFGSNGNDIYRYGGDEFVVLSVSDSRELSNKLKDINNKFIKSSMELFNCVVSFSAGIKLIYPSSSMIEIISECDDLMYSSKKNGKNQITYEDVEGVHHIATL